MISGIGSGMQFVPCVIVPPDVCEKKASPGSSDNNERMSTRSIYIMPNFSTFNQCLWMERSYVNNGGIFS